MRATNGKHPATEPEHGSLVIYCHERRFRAATVIGPVLAEPVSRRLWVGVQLPSTSDSKPVDLIDASSIIEVHPPDAVRRSTTT